MSVRRTAWFPIRVKPVRVGVYNVSCSPDQQTGLWFAYWDGKTFRSYWQDPATAFACRREFEEEGFGAGPSTQSWRGLARP